MIMGYEQDDLAFDFKNIGKLTEKHSFFLWVQVGYFRF